MEKEGKAGHIQARLGEGRGMELFWGMKKRIKGGKTLQKVWFAFSQAMSKEFLSKEINIYEAMKDVCMQGFSPSFLL